MKIDGKEIDPDRLTPVAVSNLMQTINVVGDGDPEHAHVLEDELARLILGIAATHHGWVAALAEAYLDGLDPNASRWYG